MFKLYIAVFGGRIMYFDSYIALDIVASLMEELGVYCCIVED